MHHHPFFCLSVDRYFIFRFVFDIVYPVCCLPCKERSVFKKGGSFRCPGRRNRSNALYIDERNIVPTAL